MNIKRTGAGLVALSAVLSLASLNVSTAWAAGVEVAIGDATISSVEVSDVPEGLTIYDGWGIYPDGNGDYGKEANRRFRDYVYKDYGGDKGYTDGESRARQKVIDYEAGIENLDDCGGTEEACREFMGDLEYKTYFEELYFNMGKKLIWRTPENLYLLDDDGDEYIYEGEGMKITFSFSDFEGVQEMLDKYIGAGEYEFAMLHEKHDGSFEYLPLEINKLEGDDNYEFIMTTTSLSPFAVVIMGTEVAPVKTLDSSTAYAGIAGISTVSLFGLGAWIKRKERR